MRGWLRAFAPYATSLLLHAVVVGGLALGTLFVARKILAPEPLQVELVVSPPRESPEATPQDRTPARAPQPETPPPPDRPRRRRPRPPRALTAPARTEQLPDRAQRLAPAPPTPPSDAPQQGPAAAPVFGVSLDSASAGGGTLAVAEGNTVAAGADRTGPRLGPAASAPAAGLVAPAEPLPPAEAEHRISEWPVRRDGLRFPYPEEARRAGVEGSVRLRLWLDETGHVVRAEVALPAADALDAAALANAHRLRFSPARAGAKAVPCELPYTFTFVLE